VIGRRLANCVDWHGENHVWGVLPYLRLKYYNKGL
jgi:hypothetical protein